MDGFARERPSNKTHFSGFRLIEIQSGDTPAIMAEVMDSYRLQYSNTQVFEERSCELFRRQSPVKRLVQRIILMGALIEVASFRNLLK